MIGFVISMGFIVGVVILGAAMWAGAELERRKWECWLRELRERESA